MMADYWRVYQRERRLSGKPDEEEFEDEDFDLDDVLKRMADNPDAWDEV